jgi:NADH:ubiquinone reductase (H+-translocating)
MKKIIIIGGGFAGLWSAFSAKRHLRKINKVHEAEIILINKDQYHGLRPRFYEEDLSNTRILLNDFLGPLNIKFIVGEVSKINCHQKEIVLANHESLYFDTLILASGSTLSTPNIPGLAEYVFNVDTYAAAHKLGEHIKTLNQKAGKGRFTILVIGGGFTGVEAATDFMDRLKKFTVNGELL